MSFVFAPCCTDRKFTPCTTPGGIGVNVLCWSVAVALIVCLESLLTGDYKDRPRTQSQLVRDIV